MNLKYAKRSEDTEQIKVISWAKHNESRMPELKWLYHCPNGGSRNKAEAIKFKQMGVIYYTKDGWLVRFWETIITEKFKKVIAWQPLPEPYRKSR